MSSARETPTRPAVGPTSGPTTDTGVGRGPATPASAERRQLTVLFCDLVGSTRLAGQLDPEDFHDVVRAYQAASDRVIGQFGGYISQHIGDGIVAFFGYPAAHEDDARRAVGAGRALFDALERLNSQLSTDRGITLQIRVGIHTGLVVIGQTEGELFALGEAPNVAARIVGLAEPGTLVISAGTLRLVQRFYGVEALGGQALRGVERSIALYRVVADRNDSPKDERDRSALVGRESEMTLICDRWEQAREGHGQVVFVRGEAGIGKSRLLRELTDRVRTDAHSNLVFSCLPDHQNSALQPVIDQLTEAIGIERSDSPADRLAKIEVVPRGSHPARVARGMAPRLSSLRPDPGADLRPGDLARAAEAAHRRAPDRLDRPEH
jgi:class 3 adenylate cyclase